MYTTANSQFNLDFNWTRCITQSSKYQKNTKPVSLAQQKIWYKLYIFVQLFSSRGLYYFWNCKSYPWSLVEHLKDNAIKPGRYFFPSINFYVPKLRKEYGYDYRIVTIYLLSKCEWFSNCPNFSGFRWTDLVCHQAAEDSILRLKGKEEKMAQPSLKYEH